MKKKSKTVWSGLVWSVNDLVFISGLGWMGMLWHRDLDKTDYLC